MRRSPDIEADPFGENCTDALRWSVRVLGAKVDFSSNSRELLNIAREAFAGVPQHELTSARRTLRISLRHSRQVESSRWDTPPKPVLTSGAGLLCAHIDECNFVIVNPGAATSLVQVSEAMLSHPRLLRYEMIEFAAIMLATCDQDLVALHAGCVGASGRGILLLGASGAGKSTLTLHAALDGLDYLAEDSVFVQSRTLRATGLSAFAHAREESLDLVHDRRVRRVLGMAPRIERRSGIHKREIDLRSGSARLAPTPLRLVSTVVLSETPAPDGKRLVPLSSRQLRQTLCREQPFASARPGWSAFERRLVGAGGYLLHRASPAQGVASLRALLEMH